MACGKVLVLIVSGLLSRGLRGGLAIEDCRIIASRQENWQAPELGALANLTETVAFSTYRPKMYGEDHFFDSLLFADWLDAHYDSLAAQEELLFFCQQEEVEKKLFQSLFRHLCLDSIALGASGTVEREAVSAYVRGLLDLTQTNFTYVADRLYPAKLNSSATSPILFDSLFPDCSFERQRFAAKTCFAVTTTQIRSRPRQWYAHWAKLLKSEDKFEFEKLVPRAWECIFTDCMCKASVHTIARSRAGSLPGDMADLAGRQFSLQSIFQFVAGFLMLAIVAAEVRRFIVF